ncbi:sorting nexin MVP1 [Acrasis kona]|uniref:Sorting nexin MVP1 n=1 Tax=Acrasis kona TaxID=1008807 RepID=A0AAW2ZD03_9EUKA
MVLANIIDHSRVEDEYSKKMYISFEIFCQSADGGWKLEKRYSDFSRLHSLLIHYYPPELMPKLPPKIFIGNNNESLIMKRRISLQQYLDHVLSQPDFDNDKHVDDFLQITTHCKIIQNKKERKENVNIVEALYDYSPLDATQLGFKKGDRIIILKRQSGVYYGQLKEDSKKQGTFPSNYVQFLTSLKSQNKSFVESPSKIQRLQSVTYEMDQERKERPVGKKMVLAIDHIVEPQSDQQIQYFFLKMYDRVEISSPDNTYYDQELKPGWSYVKHIKKNVCFWMPDDSLWEEPEK